MSKRLILVLVFSIVIGSSFIALPAFAHINISMHPIDFEGNNNDIYITGAISSKIPIKEISAFLDGKQIPIDLYIGNIDENNLNGKWGIFIDRKRAKMLNIIGGNHKITFDISK